jgi:hypothetical protein
MRQNYKLVLVFASLLTFSTSASAQEQVDFERQVSLVDSLVEQQNYDSARSQIYSLKSAITNTTLEKLDSVKLYFNSKLAFINFQLGNCDSTLVQGWREIELRENLYGEGHPQTIGALHNQGVYLLSCGYLTKARDVSS